MRNGVAPVLAMKRIWWIALSIGALVLSVISVVVRLSGYYYVPQLLGHALDSFVVPGELLWWITIGGVFEGFPSTIVGYVVLVLGNTVAWVLLSGIGIIAVRGATRALRSLNLSKR
jgi:hypothetical protein